MEKLKILVIVGSVRKGRVGRKVADWYMSEVAKLAPDTLDFELLDLADWNLPMFEYEASPASGQYDDLQKKLAAAVGAADGFVFVTAEYNHSIPSSLKNMIDYLYAEWRHKPAAFVGYGGVGATRAIEHLVGIFGQLDMVSLSASGLQIGVRNIWEALDDNGVPKEGFSSGNLAHQLEELAWWSAATKAARK